MLQDDAARLSIHLNTSWLAGDKLCDLEAAIRAGLHHAVHVLTGYGRETRHDVLLLAREGRPDWQVHFGESVQDMVPLLENESQRASSHLHL